jgi:hypothetical protein
MKVTAEMQAWGRVVDGKWSFNGGQSPDLYHPHRRQPQTHWGLFLSQLKALAYR